MLQLQIIQNLMKNKTKIKILNKIKKLEKILEKFLRL